MTRIREAGKSSKSDDAVAGGLNWRVKGRKRQKRSGGRPRKESVKAAALVKIMLGSGPCREQEVWERLKQEGCSFRTYHRVRRSLQVESLRVGGPKDGRWILRLATEGPSNAGLPLSQPSIEEAPRFPEGRMLSKQDRLTLALRYVQHYGSISNRQLRELTHTSVERASLDLTTLLTQGDVRALGNSWGRKYVLPDPIVEVALPI